MPYHRSPQPLPRNVLALLLHGARYCFEALRFLTAAKLWRLALAPIAVNLALGIVLFVAALWWVFPLVHGLVHALDAWAAGSTILGLLVNAVGWLLWIAVVVLLLAAGAFILVMIGQAVASPFLDLLSERIEAHVLGAGPEPMTLRRTLVSVGMSVSDLLWSLAYWVFANVPLLLLGLALPPVSAVLGFLVSAILLAQELVGLPLARRLVPYRRRFAVFRGRRSLAVGFGSACVLLMAIPGLNLVLLPVVTAGGTLLYCDLHAAGQEMSPTPNSAGIQP